MREKKCQIMLFRIIVYHMSLDMKYEHNICRVIVATPLFAFSCSTLSHPLCSSPGRQSVGLSFPEGLPGRLHRCQAALLCLAGRSCRDMHRSLRGSELRRTQHRTDPQRLFWQPERRRQVGPKMRTGDEAGDVRREDVEEQE